MSNKFWLLGLLGLLLATCKYIVLMIVAKLCDGLIGIALSGLRLCDLWHLKIEAY